MPFRRGPDDDREARTAQKTAEKEARDAQKAEERERKQQEAAEAAFLASPPGQARLAKETGQRFFQIVLEIEKVDRGATDYLLHTMNTKVKQTSDLVGAVLTGIEDEGWELVHAGYVFRETGGASRDKFLASGQQIAVLGNTLGIYLFAAK